MADSSSETSPPEDSPPSDNSTSPAPSSNKSTSPPPPSDNSTSPPPPASTPSPDTPPPESSDSPPVSPPPSSGRNGNNTSPPPPPAASSSPTPSPGKVVSPPPPNTPSNSPPTKALSPPPPPKSSSSSPSSGSSSSPSSSSSPPSSGSTDNWKIAVGVGVALGLFFILMIALCCLCTRKKKKKRPEMDYWDPSHEQKVHDYYNSGPHPNWHNSGPPPGSWGGPPPMMNSGDMSSNYSGTRPGHPPLPPPSPVVALGFNSNQFTYEELARATGGFNEANLLGQGGFGYVHKGVLPNGKEVAVKSLKSGSGQGEREFQAEVEIISRVHHRHLVSLEGYCIAGGQRMLVYEFVPNMTLEYHLHGKDCPVMDWPTRLKIALGAAKGLAYLHEDCHPRIIHRDIKAANILLDYNFEAMVADFGLAKLSSDTNTHVSTRVMGTFGYLAPEYASSGKLTEKSDVFSFGVMLLELITGKRPVDTANYMEDSLVDWARPLMAEGNYDELVDPRLEKNYDPQEMAHIVSAAAASIRHSARKRPKMSQIVRALEGDALLDDLNEGLRPGQSGMFGSGTSSEYNSYNSDMKKFRATALNSQEMVSSDYGGSSGDSKEMRRNPH